MKYIILYSLLGITFGLLAFQAPSFEWLLLWCSANCVLVAAAYGGLGAGIFGKRTDGTISKWALGLLLPYFLVLWAIWHLKRLISKEDTCNEIVPGIWLGRRALAHELPDEIGFIVDLTAEFPEPAAVREGRTYICLPTLDCSVSSDEAFRELMEKILTWSGNIYIHCAHGHGRAATVVAYMLLAKGWQKNVQEAEAFLKTLRPRVGLNSLQRQLLDRLMTS